MKQKHISEQSAVTELCKSHVAVVYDPLNVKKFLGLRLQLEEPALLVHHLLQEALRDLMVDHPEETPF